jgi:hypothetical protein
MAWTDQLKGATHLPAPITLPRYNVADIADADIEEAREAQARVQERRVIRNGRDAWDAIGKVETLEAWQRIGAALHVGKLRAIRVTRSNAGWGAAYSKEFGRWCREFGFTMRPSSRSWAIALHENAAAIEAFRQGLSERERKRLINPQSIVKRWRSSLQHSCARCPQDIKRDAMAAWRRFCACLQSLPSNEAAPLWETAFTEARAHQ